MLLITWTSGYSEGYRDLLPDALFSPAPPREIVHTVIGPNGGLYLAKCAIAKSPEAIDLDYEAFPIFNTSRKMQLGVMRIANGSGEQSPIVSWKEFGRSKYETGEAVSLRDLYQTVEDFELEHTRKGHSATVTEQVVAARRGQGLFRDGLMRRWEGRCALTGVSVDALLRASHMKPWVEATDEERLDPENGLLLAANADALFDRYLISFTPDGTLRWHDSVPHDDRQKLGLPSRLRLALSELEKGYLAMHWAIAFER